LQRDPYRLAIGLIAGLCLAAVATADATHGAPVTIVAIPWGSARIDGGAAFVVPSTVVLAPGEYRLTVERNGFSPVERTIRVDGSAPQNHLVRLDRR